MSNGKVHIIQNGRKGVPMKPWAPSDRIWDMAAKLAIPVVLAVGAMVLNHENRLTRLEEGRFTTKDAAEMEARILRYIESEGPRWLKDYLERLSVSMGEARRELVDIKERLRKLEGR